MKGHTHSAYFKAILTPIKPHLLIVPVPGPSIYQPSQYINVFSSWDMVLVSLNSHIPGWEFCLSQPPKCWDCRWVPPHRSWRLLPLTVTWWAHQYWCTAFSVVHIAEEDCTLWAFSPVLWGADSIIVPVWDFYKEWSYKHCNMGFLG